MNPLKLASILVLFLIMSGGQTILTVNQADAVCCSFYGGPPGCTKYRYYSAMVFGSTKLVNVTEEGTTFLIKDDKGFYKEFKASQEFTEQYNQHKTAMEKEAAEGKNTEKEVKGFSILNTNEADEIVLIAFVPGTFNHRDNHLGPGAITKRYNKLFESVASAPAVHPYKKISSASMRTR